MDPTSSFTALSAFSHTRRTLATNAKNPNVVPHDAYVAGSIADDPLAASNNQVIVDVESHFRRLVNGIYVLDIIVTDHENSVNIFECIHIVNQVVSIIAIACRGVDVMLEKHSRKYGGVPERGGCWGW